MIACAGTYATNDTCNLIVYFLILYSLEPLYRSVLHGPVIITKGYWAQQQTTILNWWTKLFLPLNKIILMRSLWRSIPQGYCCNNNKTREQKRKVGYNLILGNAPPFPHWRFAYVGTLFLWLWLQRYSAITLFLVPFRTLNRFSISSTMDFE